MQWPLSLRNTQWQETQTFRPLRGRVQITVSKLAIQRSTGDRERWGRWGVSAGRWRRAAAVGAVVHLIKLPLLNFPQEERPRGILSKILAEPIWRRESEQPGGKQCREDDSLPRPPCKERAAAPASGRSVYSLQLSVPSVIVLAAEDHPNQCHTTSSDCCQRAVKVLPFCSNPGQFWKASLDSESCVGMAGHWPWGQTVAPWGTSR